MKVMQNKLTPEHHALAIELQRIERYVDMVLQYIRIGSETNDLVIRECSLDEQIDLLFCFFQILAAVKHHAKQLHNFVELLISHDFYHILPSLLFCVVLCYLVVDCSTNEPLMDSPRASAWALISAL